MTSHGHDDIHNVISRTAYRASEQSRPRRDEERSEAYFKHTPQRRDEEQRRYANL
ncbi:MAG: hypothetical protein HZB79_05500 [Deltaproteobacteria bacterium]|nr:hypothetical protein [Deltaproteobacteria bacterium]